jgi:hypothetical protein
MTFVVPLILCYDFFDAKSLNPRTIETYWTQDRLIKQASLLARRSDQLGTEELCAGSTQNMW